MKCGDSKPCPTEKHFETKRQTKLAQNFSLQMYWALNLLPQVYFETKLIKGGSKVYISSAGLCNVSPPTLRCTFKMTFWSWVHCPLNLSWWNFGSFALRYVVLSLSWWNFENFAPAVRCLHQTQLAKFKKCTADEMSIFLIVYISLRHSWCGSTKSEGE